jgi:hypothetical protein
MKERRDYESRSATLHRIVEQLRTPEGGVRIEQLQDARVPRCAAERIVKRLAIRGLVRQPCAGTWEAAPPLREPAELIIDVANP